MSAADGRPARSASPGSANALAPSTYGTIVVVGGGCYGSYYVRQLGRAVAAGALRYERLVVVDRDAACRVALESADERAADAGALARLPHGADAPPPHQPIPAPVIETADWSAFFARYLARAASEPEQADRDAIVPSPLMPHLLYDWLLVRARERWPARRIETVPLAAPPSTPWQRAAPDGTHFVSFAEWMCPVNCVEPALCPEIRGPRTWSMPAAVRAYVDAESGRGRPVSGPLVFACTHRAYGVGMIDVRDVLAADEAVAAAGARQGARVLVGTVSHCHGALNLMALE